MDIASLVLGIVSILFSFIPYCNYFMIIPAIVGLILGIIDVSQKSKLEMPKGIGITGIILNALALLIMIIVGIFFMAILAAAYS